VTSCPRCGLAAEAARNFCIRCGAGLRGEPARLGDLPAGSGATILACPGCGAVNAASRVRCGRCGVHLHDTAPAGDAGDAGAAMPVHAASRAGDERTATAASPPAAGERELSRTLVAATVVSALVALVVVGSMLYQRRLVGTAAAVGAPVAQEIVAARASSSLPVAGAISYGPDNLLDERPSTAWNEAAGGPGTGEWVELVLAKPADVARLLIWNGHQKGALFYENGRVRELRIDVGDATFTAQLLDTRGPQAVDLPQPVRGDRLRLTIQEVYPGTRYDDVALSQIEVLAVP